jgi:signal transduction histidine kinase
MNRMGRLGRGRPTPRSDDRHTALLRAEQHSAGLETLVAELEARNAALEAFAAMAAHQLAEPLIIVESAAILISEDLDPDVDPLLRDRLHAIGTVAARGRRQVDALLLDARTADSPPELSSVDVSEVVHEVLELLASRIEQRRATIDIGPLPVLHAVDGLLTVIFENLISNALKYGPRQDGRIWVDAEPAAEGEWCFAITSEGPPIPPDDAERLFEPFRRGAQERRSNGHGLGLAICQRVVHRLGGSIGVVPSPTGNCFYFVLPQPD